MTNPTLRFKSADGLDFPDTVSCTLADISKYAKGTIERKTCLFIGNEQLISNFGGATLEFRTEAKGIEFSNGDILFGNIRPYLKKVWLSDQSGVASPDVLTFKATNSIPGYLKCILSSERFFNHVAQGYKGSKMPRGDKHQIMDFRIQCPCLEEQQKIASFFSTLDQKIELNERKLEALEKLKKGVIQKIFSQKLRFKDKLGTPYPTWKTAPLGYEAFVFDGTHQTPKYTLDGIPFVSVEDINSLSSITKYISEEAYLTDFKASCRAKKGDIFMTRIGDIGTPSICPKDDIAYYVSLALIKCKNNLSNNFLKFAIESDKFQSELRKRSILTAFPKKINTGEIGKCLISLPCMDEQQKIASFFSALDQKIELNERKLEGLKKLKKGLMQQMFV